MYGDYGMVYQFLEKFIEQVYVEFVDYVVGEIYVYFQVGVVGQVDYYLCQGFVQWYIGVVVVVYVFFVVLGVGQGLVQGDVDVFYCVVGINV